MSYEVYKEAVLRVLPAAPDIPLEAPPTEGFDLVDVQTCPACGSPDAAVQQVEDAEVAKCPQCQCEFSPRLESVTRKVIRRISEHRQLRLHRFMERLPLNPPVAGLDPADYALFRKVVDRLEFGGMKPQAGNEQNFDVVMQQIKSRFGQERGLEGDALEARWGAVKDRFEAALLRGDREVERRLNIRPGIADWKYANAEEQAAVPA